MPQPVNAVNTEGALGNEQDAQTEAKSVSPGKTPTTETQSQDANTTAANQEDSRPPLDSLPRYWRDLIRNLRSENQQRRETAEMMEREVQQKEQERLEASQQWEQLARNRAEEITKLKPVVTEAERLGELVRDQINAEIKDWPDEVTGTAPDGEVSALEMYNWFAKMRPLAQKLIGAEQGDRRAGRAGNSNGPNPTATPANMSRSDARTADDLIDVSRRF